jgi:hypothetical protein
MRVTEEDLSPEERGIYLQASCAVREGDYNLAISHARLLLAKYPEFFDGRKVLVEATKWKFRDEEFDAAVKTSCTVREKNHSKGASHETHEQTNDHSSRKPPTAKAGFFAMLLIFTAAAFIVAGEFIDNPVLTVSGILFFVLMVWFLVKFALTESNFENNKNKSRPLEGVHGVCQICDSDNSQLFLVIKDPLLVVDDPDPSDPDEDHACVCDACRRAVEWLDLRPSEYAIQEVPSRMALNREA